MDLYLIRHAEAVELGAGGLTDDAARPLTDLGRVQCRQLALALRTQGVKLDRLVTSPLVRAVQTAHMLLEHDLAREIVVTDHLVPGSRKKDLVAYLRALGDSSLGVVGHEPHLSVFTAWVLGGKAAQLAYAKAGAARVEFGNRVGKGKGTLRWLVTPAWCAPAECAPA